MNHEEYFNQLAVKWDSIVKVPREKLNYVLDKMELSVGLNILDIGTGTGVLIPFIREKIGWSGKLAAIDISDNMLTEARKKFDGFAEFVWADVLALPFPDNSFDRVICYSVFPHFPDKSAALREMARVLKTGGSIIVAHSEGRERVNHFHHSQHSFVSQDLLPEDSEMLGFGGSAGLKSGFCENSAHYYIVKFQKTV